MKEDGLFNAVSVLLGERPKSVVQCGSHALAPYSFICVHLGDGSASEWNRVDPGYDDPRDVECDWLCPKCLAKYERGTIGLDDLLPCCVHCVRSIQKNASVSCFHNVLEGPKVVAIARDGQHRTSTTLLCADAVKTAISYRRLDPPLRGHSVLRDNQFLNDVNLLSVVSAESTGEANGTGVG